MATSSRSSSIELSTPLAIWSGSSYHHLARAGDFLFLAGQVARNSQGEWVGLGNAGAQAAQIYRNIGAILASAHARASDVVKVNTILVSRGDNAAVTAQRLAFFGDHRPPHTGMI